MSRSLLGSLLGAVFLAHSGVASAQRVVVLDFSGDRAGLVRAQVQQQLSKAGMHVVSFRQYKAAATKKKLKGAQLRTPQGVAVVAKALKLDGAVTGTVGKSLRVRLLDAAGRALFASRFLMKKGALSRSEGLRLAEEISRRLAPQRSEPPPTPSAAAPKPMEEPPAPPAAAEEKSHADFDQERHQREEMAEAHTEPPPLRAEPVAQMQARRPSIGPPVFTAQITGTTTWRSYCARPGFSSCAQYNATDPGQRPPGDTVDFKAEVPYVGFSLAAEFFPFAETSNLLRGLGLLAGYERGFSLTNVKVLTSTGDATTRRVYAADQAINALAAFRYFFFLSQRQPLSGYAGVHAGFGTRRFDVDSNAQAPLPGSHRNYPEFGLDVSIPIWSFLRIEGSANYFISPKPIASEIADYGSGSSASGWGADAGVTGGIWGPLGYVVRLRYSQYKDQFGGSGTKWQSGGAAEESYLGAYWGATAHF